MKNLNDASRILFTGLTVLAALALWVAHPVIFAFVLAVVLAWPLIKFAIKSWLAGFFGAEGVKASGLFKPRKPPRPEPVVRHGVIMIQMTH